MRNAILLVMAGAALILSVLAYQRVEEMSDIVYRLDAQMNQDSIQRNRVVTLGKQLENLTRSITGTGRKGASATQ